MQYDLRKADMTDLEPVSALFERTAAYLLEQGIDQWDDKYPDIGTLKNDISENNMYVLCGDKKSIVAAIVINEEQEDEYKQGDWKDIRAGVIHRLCVDPKHQSGGHGRTMVDFAERLIKQKGLSSVRLDVFSQNPKACSFYKNLGYAYAGEVTFRKGRFILMEKLLYKTKGKR